MKEFNKRPESKEGNKLWDLTERYNSSFEPDMPSALKRLKNRIAAEDSSKDDKVVPFSRRRILSIAAGVILLIGGFLLIDNLLSKDVTTLTAETSIDKTMYLALEDGSKVWLNKNSKFTYPESFSGNQRLVQLEGEAFFEIAKDASKPFIIETIHNQIEVLGTAFNVRHFSNESFCEVQVREGKVKFSASVNNQSVILNQNDKGLYNISSQKLEKFKDFGKHAGAWQTNSLKFNDEKLSQVIPEIERFYNVKIEISQEEMNDCTLNTRFENTSIEDVLKVLTRVFNFELMKKPSGTYLLSGGTC